MKVVYWLHIGVSLLTVASFLLCLVLRKGSHGHRRSGFFFFFTMGLTTLTGLQRAAWQLVNNYPGSPSVALYYLLVLTLGTVTLSSLLFARTLAVGGQPTRTSLILPALCLPPAGFLIYIGASFGTAFFITVPLLALLVCAEIVWVQARPGPHQWRRHPYFFLYAFTLGITGFVLTALPIEFPGPQTFWQWPLPTIVVRMFYYLRFGV